jgi:hypothetical protein
MTMAGAWYESGNFWQFAVTTIVAVAVGALGAVATTRAGNPKRKINWWVQSNTPLVSLPQFAAGGGNLSVQFAGRTVVAPRVVELVIANQGRHDITAGMFHGDETIRFDFATGVCTVLDVVSTPSGTMNPQLDTGTWGVVGNSVSHESWLDVKPFLLSRGQVVSVTILLDGDEAPVTCLRAPLVEVDVVSVAPASAASGNVRPVVM